MEISELFDSLLRLRDLSRWASDNAGYGFLMRTACVAPFLEDGSANVAHFSSYWRHQAALLRRPRAVHFVQTSLRRFVERSQDNERAALEVCSDLRKRRVLREPRGERESSDLYLPEQLHVQVQRSPAYQPLSKRVDRALERTGKLSRADVHSIAHLSEEAEVDQRRLALDQYAMLVSWALKEPQLFTGLQPEALASRSDRFADAPIRYNGWWAHDVSIPVLGYSLTGRLRPRSPATESTEGGSELLSFSASWGTGRGVVSAETGTFRAVIVPNRRAIQAEEAARMFVSESLTHSEQ